jgi:hypothetical protein
MDTSQWVAVGGLVLWLLLVLAVAYVGLSE